MLLLIYKQLQINKRHIKSIQLIKFIFKLSFFTLIIQQSWFFLTISIVDRSWKIVIKWRNKCCIKVSESTKDNSMTF